MPKKQNPGKMFEQDFLKSIPSNVFKLRLKDDTLKFKNVTNPADIIMFGEIHPLKTLELTTEKSNKILFLLELKSTKEKSLSYANIKQNQFDGLYDASKIDGILAGFVINFRCVNETYFLEINKAIQYKDTNCRKSFPIEFVRQNGILIPCKKKRTRYTYDINTFLESI